ncbi:H-NS histone family protein [Undibacterium aquatile]|uniref:H-NS histone family protein n=1 Tax=Undibacterium aquatile TaxID=1537398 RepID=A0ABR6XBL9_9BURK|nr:H-NS histone family protein [Undibacterium aquatile]MBC3810098.1 H-NS histone family protein [Undibacterium aquatile]
MQIETNINPVTFVDSLDDDTFLQFQVAAERRTEEIRTRKKAAAIVDVNSKIKFYGMTLTDLFALKEAKQAMKAKGATMPAKIYDPATGVHWSGNGTTPKAFKDAMEFDKANLTVTPKRMDQYLIPDDKAKEIALKIKKDVRTISDVVIKYADLVAETSNQPVVQLAA